MNQKNDLNVIKYSIIDFAHTQNLSASNLQDEWQSNYQSDWNENLRKDMHSLCLEMELFQKALLEEDRTTQIAALVVARVRAMNLRNFFDDMFEDIEKMAGSEEFLWPKIPEGYEIPKHYNDPKK
ncbi:hypothetical protein [[Enterobacter] lignolyticus]|uniref:Uncharacterized protein n=1 Tax=Enterobacter lignolyticus (strain SCF1) TaxID=701347 RepID=E3G4S8_ENTLS|nr:hypothetical protein [[Enterobacter] lignolyticus]ADO50546.1 hypothetical protein Entcl_4315 [[Enterobacter] lignolyticus SCF1]